MTVISLLDRNSGPGRGTVGAALMGAALLVSGLAADAGARASTRDDLDRLALQMADLDRRVTRLEEGQASLLKAVEALSARIDALGRAAQTADLRIDLDILKRQVESLASQVGGARGSLSPTPAPPSSSPPPADAPRPAPGVDLYAQAHRDYLQGRYELASLEFRQFLEASPDDDRAPGAQYWIGECLYSQKRFEEAREAFGLVVERYPGSPKVRAAKLKVGYCHISAGDGRVGRRILGEVIEEYPGTDEAQLAREKLEHLGP